MLHSNITHSFMNLSKGTSFTINLKYSCYLPLNLFYWCLIWFRDLNLESVEYVPQKMQIATGKSVYCTLVESHYCLYNYVHDHYYQVSPSSGSSWSINFTCVKGKNPCLPFTVPSHCPFKFMAVTNTSSPT